MVKEFGSYPVSSGQRFIFNYLISFSLLRGKPGKVLARKLWDLFSLSPAEAIYDFERWGVRFRLHLDNNYLEKKVIFNRRNHDGKEFEIFKERLSDGDSFIDIGANVGYWGLRVAQTFPKSKILCFEPNPILHDRLLANISLNNFGDRMTASPFAISDSNGMATLCVQQKGGEDYNFGEGSIDKNLIRNKDAEGFESFAEIKTKLLADALKDYKIGKVDALKIDVEGHEAKAMMPYLRGSKIEDLPHTMLVEHVSSNCWEEDVIAYLLELGYKILYNKSINTVLGR